MNTLSRQDRRRVAAFTLLEMLVAVSILVVIIFTLTQMFNQTQRAFRGGVRQVDVMEAGRAAMEVISYELRQMAPSRAVAAENFALFRTPESNVYRDPADNYVVHQRLADNTRVDHVLGDFLFWVRPTPRSFRLNGFFVAPARLPAPYFSNAFGTLYRFSPRTNATPAPNYLVNKLGELTMSDTNSYMVCDGVINFRVSMLRENGTVIPPGSRPTGENLPAAIDVELTLLDPPLAELARSQARGVPLDYVNVTNFLVSRAEAIHTFRQTIRIPAAPR